MASKHQLEASGAEGLNARTSNRSVTMDHHFFDSAAITADDKHRLTMERLASLTDELQHVRDLLSTQIRKREELVRARSDDVDQFIAVVGREEALRKIGEKIVESQDVLRWRALGAQSSIGISPAAAQRLAQIQKETGAANGAVAAFGAALTLSVLFSATRGNMWWIFASWWCFIISIALAGFASIVSAGSNPAEEHATQGNWRVRRASVVLICITYFGTIIGLASLCISVIYYDVGPEIEGELPHITAGPNLTWFGDKPANYALIVGLIIVAMLALFYFSAYIIRLGVVIRFQGRTERRKRTQEIVRGASDEVELGEEHL